MTDNPDWAKVLQFLKKRNGHYRREAKETEIEQESFTPPQVAERMLAEDLCNELNIEGREHMLEVLGYLNSTLNLVNFSSANNAATLSLEPDGFEVAHERELSKRQEKINSALVAFTVVLVLVNLVANFSSDSRNIANGVILVTLLLLVFRTDILDLPSL